jgi:hypothetical protein
MTHAEIARTLKEQKENIILLYAFNATGKTRLCVEYKDFTKAENGGQHAGVYYNAYSEDLFQWDNDEENANQNIRLVVVPSKLNRFHGFLNHAILEEKLAAYSPKYSFALNPHDSEEDGIASVSFYKDPDDPTPYKISRGEERIFVWSFFLALFEVEEWSKDHNAHIYIDDPVSSLDDHNIFLTVESIMKLFELNDNYIHKRIIISTHHVGLFSILYDRLMKGEKSERYKKLTSTHILSEKNGELKLTSIRKEVFLYHLQLLQLLETVHNGQPLRYHVILLRQVLENIASFLGTGRASFVLQQIGRLNVDDTMTMINSLSHQSAYQYRMRELAPAEQDMFNDVFSKLMTKYQFELH